MCSLVPPLGHSHFVVSYSKARTLLAAWPRSAPCLALPILGYPSHQQKRLPPAQTTHLSINTPVLLLHLQQSQSDSGGPSGLLQIAMPLYRAQVCRTAVDFGSNFTCPPTSLFRLSRLPSPLLPACLPPTILCLGFQEIIPLTSLV